eukprot:m.188198 g.188198  ORF g.188198 m.188198 type:complete len:142 (-) comp10022_c3_seq18:249-674(-)
MVSKLALLLAALLSPLPAATASFTFAGLYSTGIAANGAPMTSRNVTDPHWQLSYGSNNNNYVSDYNYDCCCDYYSYYYDSYECKCKCNSDNNYGSLPDDHDHDDQYHRNGFDNEHDCHIHCCTCHNHHDCYSHREGGASVE